MIRIEPFNKKFHDVLMRKGYTWTWRDHLDIYKKDQKIIFVYMNNYAFMIVNGETLSLEEFQIELEET
jgi:hypothetical protein